MSFTKKDIQMAKNHVKRYSTTLVIREMQVRAKMSYHSTSIIIVKMNKIKLTRVWNHRW